MIKVTKLLFGITVSADEHVRLHAMLYPQAVKAISDEMRQGLIDAAVLTSPLR